MATSADPTEPKQINEADDGAEISLILSESDDMGKDDIFSRDIFEEKEISDGEVSSEEESEEGEIKDDDDDNDQVINNANIKSRQIKKPGNSTTTQSNVTSNNQQPQQKTSICKFYAKGQCTWGANCRFLHVNTPQVPMPMKLPNQRGHPYQAGLHPTGLHPTGAHPTGPTGAHLTGHHPTGHHQSRSYGMSEDGHDQPVPFSYMAPPIARHPLSHLGPPLPPPHHHPPASQSSSSSSNPESAWERGLRHAKEMIVKASKRKEEEVDFDDKRFNLGVDDEGTSHSRHSHRSRDSPEYEDYEGSRPRSRTPPLPPHLREGYRERDRNREFRDRDREREREREREQRERERERRSNRDEFYDTEYERRRRLAFESAPWNKDRSPSPSKAPPRSSQRSRENAEMYRDPWRRSKSPPTKWPTSSRRVESSSASKRSHSMSSISESESGSNLSDSESGSGSDSSTASGSYSDASEASSHSPKHGDRKPRGDHLNQDQAKITSRTVLTQGRDRTGGNQPSRAAPGRERVPPIGSKNRSSRSSLDDEIPGSVSRRKGGEPSSPPPATRPRRDSWSDSGSSRSGSSPYSGSASESDAFSQVESDFEQNHRSKTSFNRSREPVKPPARSPPISGDGGRKNIREKRSYSPPSEPSTTKKAKVSSNSSNKMYREDSSRSKNSPGNISPASFDKPISSPSPEETPQKKNLIKMTFKKKHPSLKQDRNLTARLNSGNESDEDEQDGGRSRSPSPPLEPQVSPRVKSSDSSKKPSFRDCGTMDEIKSSERKAAKIKNVLPSSSARNSMVGADGPSSRREDLLKQLKAVEAMIAKKKGKTQ